MNPIVKGSLAAVTTRGFLFALFLFCVVVPARAQPLGSLTFVGRVGSNIAYCGPLGGPGVQHNFSTPTATSDSISVSDPGGPNWGTSSANSQLTANPTATGISITASGSAMRSGTLFGTSATADARDGWTFTLSSAVHFTLNVSVSATTTEAVVSTASFLFGGTTITPDPGSTPPPYSGALSAPGTITLVASGTLGPGLYVIYTISRTESNSNSWPFAGSFQTSFVLSLQPLAAATSRTAAPNLLSYTSNLPILGQVWTGTINLALSGHAFAQPFLSLTATQAILPGNQVLLIGFPIFELTPPLSGPQATFSIPLPQDPALAGLTLPTQVLHFGGAPSFALSNALDLSFGY